MSTMPAPLISEEEYLAIERNAEWKSEYHAGKMYAMAGASLRHVIINDNLVIVFGRELAGSGCRAYTRDLRLHIPASGLYTYPDVLVICGKVELATPEGDVVTNPKVIVEILSPTTQNYDRGDKFADYRTIPEFCEYLLIAQDRMHAEHFKKQPDGGWLLHETSDGNAVIALESIGVRFTLSEAYTGVDLSLRESA
jgi:Uma2 family endonuclease